MENPREINFLDYIVLLVKWKKFIFFTVLITMIVSYVGIYFLIEEEFESKALILPSDDNSMSGMAGLMKGLKGLPIDISGSIGTTSMSVFNTILSSRTTLEEIILKYDLIKVYKLETTKIDYEEQALKRLRSSINAEETDDDAYEITVVAPSGKLAANIANSLIEILNRRLIELKVQKSTDNRMFLEKRLVDVQNNLRQSEDSLRWFQESSGILDTKEQVKGLLNAYSTIETSLITKQVEQTILEKIYTKDAPSLQSMQLQIGALKEKMEEIKKNGQKDGLLLSYDKLPKNVIDYLRLYRDVEINSTLLEFILPLYEQAKFEEQKDIPVLQIVDNAIPPAKKSYPPRTVYVLLIGFSTFFLLFLLILLKENPINKNSKQIQFIKRNLFRWKILN